MAAIPTDHPFATTGFLAAMGMEELKSTWPTILNRLRDRASQVIASQRRLLDLAGLGFTITVGSQSEVISISDWEPERATDIALQLELNAVLSTEPTPDRLGLQSVHLGHGFSASTVHLRLEPSVHSGCLWAVFSDDSGYESKAGELLQAVLLILTPLLEVLSVLRFLHPPPSPTEIPRKPKEIALGYLSILQRGLGCDCALAWRVDSTGQKLVLFGRIGIPDHIRMEMPLEAGYLGAALLKNDIQFIPHIDPSEAYHSILVQSEGWKSMAVFPLLLDSVLSGAVSVYWKSERTFTYLDGLIGTVGAEKLQVLLHDTGMMELREGFERDVRRNAYWISAGLMSMEIIHDVRDRIVDVRDGFDSLLKGRKLSRAHQTLELEIRDNISFIGDILAKMSRAENLERARPATIDLWQIVLEVEKSVSPMAQRRGVTLEKRGRPGFAIVRADPQHIERILFNLVTNAIHFTGKPHKGERVVTMRLERKGDRVSVSVKDTGTGIDPKHRDRLFDLFYTTRGEMGMGLGLYIAKRLAQRWGADIEVDSQFGKGAEFILTMSLAGGPT